ncbi:type VI secretion system tip protein TssI/VgrG [Photobacterium lutimaris]|uniref:Type VI secretion system tip protein VgrG n=1 Tax=Photobacterium lutimaris TaxID=388278 RepID=A0A2T3IZN1_9GAMM|nr:type VI secretion system tip protein TssI/VgrG [Photobacterium lutimaris]PSU34141.1 type VI secretion system tip protein VgrG [Photobacterium lutimaris]TDR75714.1 type VI secretion system secreted protein VgrG [Photobacterium lutimaris]
MKKATQDNNVLRLETPLGKDALHITKAEFREGLSMPFSIQADVYSNGQLVDPSAIIGKAVTITLLYNNNGNISKRYFNGVVTRLRSTGSRMPANSEGELYQDYLLEISPSLLFLAHRVNCKIYQKISVDEIIKTIFSEHKVKVQSELTKTYPIYDYKVQYHETDLAFVSRILEQEGIFYFFKHDKTDHYLVLADDITAYTECPESQVAFTTGSLSEAHIHTWTGGLDSAPGSSVKQGYDFVKPVDKPQGQHVDAEIHPQQSATEVFEYLAGSEFINRAQEQANITLDSLQRDIERCSGGSNCRSFSAGQYFTFKSHEDSRLKGKSFLITQLLLEVTITSQSGAQKSSHQTIQNKFTCVPQDTLYRPKQVTPKPKVHGVQSACVTGEEGDEIHIDKYGRVKALFHWDREGTKDSTSSCWIRVAQNWAGNRWGAFFFPRVGQEVLVEFLDGDPDQPIISGALYNGEQMPPYDLPGEKTKSGIKTRSTKEGSDENFNEIRFEDDKGNELIYIHAEKDHQLVIENDYLSLIENNSSETIKNDSQLLVENNYQQTVKNDYILKVDNNQSEKIGKELVIDAGSKITLKAGGASISLSSSGAIDIKGTSIKVNGSAIALKAGSIALN